ncbi:hypothetical protein [Planktothrix agardhii]|uniref:hypothetical protein n=1 Tax=Planktothrix agardhii TaxID=1160 RepID=UPI001F1F1A5F|nr:hypothetical protein [Planktothrix agardhii]MCF3575745.1 hypothetical protein [Planktothrix agardhii 1812]
MYNQQNINQKSTETPTEEDALGIKNPLLTPTTLGQNFLSLQSISPLGSRSINLINWSLISPNQTLLQNFQDNENWQDSSISEFRPFSKNSLTENSPIIEPQSDKTLPSSVPIQLSSELPIQQPPETSFIDSESPIPQPPETPSFDSESPIGQTENIFPFQIDQKTRRNSVIQNSKSSTSHFFQKKSEFPREKISQENVNKLTKKSAENQDISTTEESVINSIETNDLQTINPTDIPNPEIPVSTLQKQPESVSDIQKQTESQTVAQLLRQPGAIPQLPQVLENITHSKPLGISKSLIQPSKLISETSFLQTNPMLSKDEHENVLDNLDQFASPSTINIEPKSEPNFNNESSKQGIMIQQQESDFSTSDVPDSWSSIEELLGESNSTPSKPTVVQAFFKKEGRQAKHRKHQHQTLDFPAGMLLPPGISSGVAGIHNLDLQQQPTSVKVLMEKTIQTRIQQEQKTASRKAEPVETLTRSNLGLEYHQSSSASVAQKEETKQAETKTDQVEVLAREIYGLVRQRFEIERERQGSSYDRRLF